MDWSISNSMVSGYFLKLPCFIEIYVHNANSIDPDQTLCSAVSDLGLYCLPITICLEFPDRHEAIINFDTLKRI